MSNNEEQILKLTLLLIYLNSWEEKNIDKPIHCAWKGDDFDTLNALEEKGYISQSKTAKSVYLTEEGQNLQKNWKNYLSILNKKNVL